MSPSRSTRRRVATEVLAQLTAARDQLDAAAADRRRREDELLREWASAAGEAAAVVDRRDTALADLERQRRAVVDDAAAETAAIETRQAAALAELIHFRTAEEIGGFIGLNEKRVRHIVRGYRETSAETPDRHHPSAAGAPAADGEQGRPPDSSTPPVEEGRELTAPSRAPARGPAALDPTTPPPQSADAGGTDRPARPAAEAAE